MNSYSVLLPEKVFSRESQPTIHLPRTPCLTPWRYQRSHCAGPSPHPALLSCAGGCKRLPLLLPFSESCSLPASYASPGRCQAPATPAESRRRLNRIAGSTFQTRASLPRMLSPQRFHENTFTSFPGTTKTLSPLGPLLRYIQYL